MGGMRTLMIILLVDALVCGMVVGRMPMENPEPAVKKAVGRETPPPRENSCYEWAQGRE